MFSQMHFSLSVLLCHVKLFIQVLLENFYFPLGLRERDGCSISKFMPNCIMNIEIIRTVWRKIAYESVATCLCFSFSLCNCSSMILAV